MTITTGALLVVLFGIVLAVMIVKAVDNADKEGHDTTLNGITIAGFIIRTRDGDKFYVLDPVSGDQMRVGVNADLYEDANGKIWLIAKA